MNNAAVITEVSRKTGVAPDVCERVVKALERTLQENVRDKSGAGLLNKLAGAVYRMTLPQNP